MEPQVVPHAALDRRYEHIVAFAQQQHEHYNSFLARHEEDQRKWMRAAEEMHLDLDVGAGRIRYKPTFQPPSLDVEICYIRHGKTDGNTEPRVFQGFVDYPSNQLNAIGKEQAAAAAERLEQFVCVDHWGKPDLIVASPLQRACETAAPYREKHPDIPFSVIPELAEMKFGSWDNVKVVDMPPDSICHLFYREQNALVKSDEPHRVNSDLWQHPESLQGETEVESENFIECMQRQISALRKVEAVAKQVMADKGEQKKARVVVYGHSMAGAATSILLGFGESDAAGWLGFDGSFIMPNATPSLLVPGAKQKKQ